MSDWTQAVCTSCWNERNPDKAHIDVFGLTGAEMCCWCGNDTTSGIYVRVDPATVPFPTQWEEFGP
jgi:hypothetical protein